MLPATARIGGQSATILFYGEAPNIVAGLMFLNVLIPDAGGTTSRVRLRYIMAVPDKGDTEMKRLVQIVLLALVAFVLVAETPKGWKMRVDRSTSASDPDAGGNIKFETM